jgi:hypothetical protein
MAGLIGSRPAGNIYQIQLFSELIELDKSRRIR